MSALNFGDTKPTWLQDIVLDLRPEWGSEHLDHSAQIHAAIKAGGFLSSSISHTKGLGGFVASRSKAHLGLDIEIATRVTAAISTRITHPADDSAPGPAHLWCAKESSFKALRELDQPSVITQLAITNWTLFGQGAFSFQCQTENRNLNSRAYVWPQAKYLISICQILF